MISERVGIILVHGIGEQRRFQHLDSQLRDLIRALQGIEEVTQISVDIAGSAAAAFQAEQDTWNAGPEASITVVVHHRLTGQPRETRLMVHEVWWADVNERYSIAKQFRFWLWGLAVWWHPDKMRSTLGTADRVAPPILPTGGHRLRGGRWDRFRLFLVGVVFVLVAYSIGTITVLLTRLLNWQAPDLLRVMANYVSAVKLYNQQHRFGPGIPADVEDFLDTMGEPPRVSVRRRMIRAIADVACNDYDRWYVLAHSQGSVVAFNGLMETAYAWPGYLNQDRWNRLAEHKPPLVGPGRDGMEVPAPGKKSMPRRPAWLANNKIAYRSRIFSRFRGFLTYGSPLEKFAGLWPAVVPISRERAFAAGIPWFNIYDPIDPVSGRLLAFGKQPVECCPRAQDICYPAGRILLLAHLKYLNARRGGGDVATATVKWLLTDAPNFPASISAARQAMRKAVAWASWIIFAVVLLLLGAVILPMILKAAGKAISATGEAAAEAAPYLGWLGNALLGWTSTVIASIAAFGENFWCRLTILAVFAFALTAFVGALAHALPMFFRRDDDDIAVAGDGDAPPPPDSKEFLLDNEEPEWPHLL